MRILYIGARITKIEAGGDVVNSANQRILSEISSGNMDYVDIPMISLTDKIMLGNKKHLKMEIAGLLSKNEYAFVFVSQSKYGGICKFIKRKFPRIPIMTFLHNVELHYAEEYVKIRGIRAIPFYLSVLFWERIAIKYSDRLICLNSRDSRILSEYYGRTSDAIIPVAAEDHPDSQSPEQDRSLSDIDYLFVGSAFFPNIQGIQWFIDSVMPFLKGNLYVVGKGMSRDLFSNLSDNIHIIGFAPDLRPYYDNAAVVVSPIFSGGGMKTKTAEALSFGKTIIGTAEAFEGYDIDERCMYLCTNAEQFIAKLRENLGPKFNPYSRQLYETNCSIASAKKKFETLLHKTGINRSSWNKI